MLVIHSFMLLFSLFRLTQTLITRLVDKQRRHNSHSLAISELAGNRKFSNHISRLRGRCNAPLIYHQLPLARCGSVNYYWTWKLFFNIFSFYASLFFFAFPIFLKSENAFNVSRSVAWNAINIDFLLFRFRLINWSFALWKKGKLIVLRLRLES